MSTTEARAGTRDVPPTSRTTSRARPWAALVAAAAPAVPVVAGLLPLPYAAPVIGVVLALGCPPDRVGGVRPVARRRRNAALGAALLAALAVVVWQPQLTLPLVVLFGMDGSGAVVTALSVLALALPLAMTDAPDDGVPAGRFVLTRRDLVLSLTALVSVAAWYGGLGHSFVPVAVLVLALPLLLGAGRAVAARHGGLELGLLRSPLRPGLGAHRLQLLNVTVCCGLVALTVPTGAYSAVAVQLPGAYPVLLALFCTGLVALVVLALLPLRRVRLASNAVVAAGAVFLASQLVSVHRPPDDALTIGPPLAEEGWVGHGGNAELTNYHRTSPLQADAVDLVQVGAGGIHRPGSTELSSYHVYDDPVLAPVDGTVTFVVDGLPDQPIGSVDQRHPTGNQLVIDVGGGVHLLLGHLREGSIAVDVGDRVREGQRIARVGNSGHSSAPHLHLQAQTLPTGIADLGAVDLPRALRTLHTHPLRFRDTALVRGGVESRPPFVDPRRGDVLRPTR